MLELIPPKESIPRNEAPIPKNILRFGLSLLPKSGGKTYDPWGLGTQWEPSRNEVGRAPIAHIMTTLKGEMDFSSTTCASQLHLSSKEQLSICIILFYYRKTYIFISHRMSKLGLCIRHSRKTQVIPTLAWGE
jgi:hypothetical protein